uniref:Uncharacterized protein n=1 Tax=Panagrolaimus davidi TaxID=227884 RepID=A0A914PXM4_9BILA
MAKEGADGGRTTTATSKNLLQMKKVREFEEYAKSSAKPGIHNYNVLRVLNRCYDSEDEIVEDFQLVEQATGNRLQYTMQCIELKDRLAVTNTLREIHILQHFGCDKFIMSMYSVFRHRQYIAMVFPAFVPIRNHLDVRYRFKNEGGKPGTGEARFQEASDNYYEKFMLFHML